MGINDIVANMRTRSSEELVSIYAGNDRITWSDSAFEAIRQVLSERGVPVPQQALNMVVQGKFRKVQVPMCKEYGRYRGAGLIQVTDEHLRIVGHHVHSLRFRWAAGLGIFLAVLVLSLGTLILGVIPIYLIMEYVWLKREETIVPFSAVKSYLSDSSKGYVAIDFAGDPWRRPVVLQTRNWQELMAVLRGKIPDRDAVRMVLPPSSKGAAITRSALVFVGWYLLFQILCMVALGVTILITGIDSVPEIKNVAVRWLIWCVLFGLPLLCSALLARRSYRRQRSAHRLDGSCVPPEDARRQEAP